MSGLRLRETFNRLLENQFVSYVKKGTAALVIAATLVFPAAADHNHADDLTKYKSDTEHSEQLRSIQDKFNRAVQDRRIILIDRDWLQINSAVNDIGQDQELRNRYLTEYLLTRGSLHMVGDYFKGMTDRDLLSPHSQLFAVPIPNQDPMQVCLVFGGRGELDGQTAVEDFIDVSRVLHGDELADADIQMYPDAEQFKEFVTYHEIGHCMDDYFLANMGQAQTLGDYLALYHRAETFADVFGVLMMARDEGVTDIAEIIANKRLANMALSGPFQTAWSNPNSITHYASYIYATHDSVRAAQDYLDQNGVAGLQNMSYQDIAKLAQDITAKNALDDKEVDALLYLFAMEFDTGLWDRMRGQVKFVDERYQQALELKAKMEAALRNIFDLSHIPAGQSVLDGIPFNADPAAVFKEAQAEQPDANILEARALALSQELLLKTGHNPTIERLIDVFSELKDEWRETLSNGSAAEREKAMQSLQVAGQALGLAAKEIRGPAPAEDFRPEMPDIKIDLDIQMPPIDSYRP